MWGATKREFIKAKNMETPALTKEDKQERRYEDKYSHTFTQLNIIQQQNKRANAQTKGYLY